MNRLLFLIALIVSPLFSAAQFWIHSAGSQTIDEGTDVVIDANQNSITVGYFTNVLTVNATSLSSAGLDDIFMMKTSPTGIVNWIKRAGGTNSDKALAVDADAQGSIVVTGFFYNSADFDGNILASSGQQDVFIAKYNAAGTILWAIKAGGMGSDVGNDVAFDNAGNVIVTGEFSGSCTFGSTTLTSMNGSLDVFTAKYDPNGNFLWAVKGSAKYTDRGTSIATDAYQNIYVAGMFSDTITFDVTHNNPMYNAMFVIKYNPAGQEQWFRWMGSGAVVGMAGVSVHNNDVNIAGNFEGTLYFFGAAGNPTLSSTYSHSIFVMRMDTNGSLIWSHADGSDNEVTAHAIVAKPNGEIAVGGNFRCRMSGFSATYGSGVFCSVGYWDTYVSSYSTTGTWQWARQYGGQKDDNIAGISAYLNSDLITAGSYTDSIWIPTRFSNTTYYGVINIDYERHYKGIPNYCSDNDYDNYVLYRSHGNKDILLHREIDPLRQPYDFFNRNGSTCSRPFLDICLGSFGPTCLDTVAACDTTTLYVNFNSTSGNMPNYNYLWSDGSSYNGLHVSVSGNYGVTVTSNDGCYINSDTVYFLSHPYPPKPLITDSKGININAYYPQNIPICLPDSVQLTCPNAAGYTVGWSGFPIGQNPITVYAGGYYTVTLSSPFCTSFNRVYVVAGNALPNVIAKMSCLEDADHNDSITLCKGQQFHMLLYDSLSNPTGSVDCFPGMSYAHWTSTNSAYVNYATASICNPYSTNGFQPTQTGNYDFIISAWIFRKNPCDTDSVLTTKKINVTINPVPTGSLSFTISGPSHLCFGDTAYLVASPASNNYNWSTGMSGDSVVISAPGNYSAYSSQILTNSFGCSATISGSSNINVLPYPQPNVTMVPSNGLICPNDSVRLICSGTGAVSWQGPNGNIAATTSSIYVNVPGYYYALQTVAPGCVVVSNTVQVIQYNIPLIFASPQGAFCGNDSVVLSVISNPGSTIQWVSPLSGSGQTQTINAPGTYFCNVISCAILTPLSFTVYQDTARAEITSPDSTLTFCDGDSVLLVANPGMSNYLWLPAVTGGTELYVLQGGQYQLTTMSAHGCVAVDSIFITETPNPLLPPLSTDTTFCAGMSATLTVSGMDTLIWSMSPLFDTIIQTGTTYRTGNLFANTVYYLQSYSGQCKSATDTLDVFIDEHCHYITLPNIITPNDDGLNDYFPSEPGFYLLDLKIFNRWGKLVFETSQSPYGWNGISNEGTQCPDGTYYFIVAVSFYDGTIQKGHGPLELIR